MYIFLLNELIYNLRAISEETPSFVRTQPHTIALQELKLVQAIF